MLTWSSGSLTCITRMTPLKASLSPLRKTPFSLFRYIYRNGKLMGFNIRLATIVSEAENLAWSCIYLIYYCTFVHNFMCVLYMWYGG
ncbi:hypothetical protein LINPERPRIM_LOCUS24053 [Linum perenne]